jgi:hypothetical protein
MLLVVLLLLLLSFKVRVGYGDLENSKFYPGKWKPPSKRSIKGNFEKVL